MLFSPVAIKRVPQSRSLRRSFTSIHPNEWSDATVLFGGGGARGLAHLGAMRAIGQSGIGVGRMVGVSMGALMASLCAVHRDVERAELAAREFLTSDECGELQAEVFGAARDPNSSGTEEEDSNWRFRIKKFLWLQRFLARAARQPSLLSGKVLSKIIDPLLPDIAIEDLSTPLHLIAVDMRTGKRVVLSTGSLREAVRCSMSIPGVFPLVRRGRQLLGDVGVYDAVPCDLVRQIMDREESQNELIAVDVGKTDSSNASCRTAIHSVLRFQELAEQQIRDFQLATADVVVRPKFKNVPWFDFSAPGPLIDAGFQAASLALHRRQAATAASCIS